ncbi:MAG: hypothetical protein HY340_03245 [Candidatus Kerfeldbacteria bacterium]|nr:hypothetical protein [Candidatus Kerfeldbacteria bacterium]
MKQHIIRGFVVSLVAIAVTSGVAWAATVRDITSRLGGKTGDFFDLNGTLLVDSIKIGAQGVGGVTFFNGSILNNTTDANNNGIPVTFADDVRIDGSIWRGATSGPGDTSPLRLNDDVRVFGNLTVDSGKTITVTGATWVGLTQSAITSPAWTADDIVDTTRKLVLPLSSFYTDADGTPAAITATTEPNLIYTANQGHFLQYAEDDTVDVGTQFVVPDDYASGGVFKAVVDTSGAIVTNWDLDFKVAISQATGSSNAWDTDMDNETAVDVTDTANKPRVMTFTPTDQADISAGDTIFFDLFPASNTGAGEPNVEIYNIWFEYTAKQ